MFYESFLSEFSVTPKLAKADSMCVRFTFRPFQLLLVARRFRIVPESYSAKARSELVVSDLGLKGAETTGARGHVASNRDTEKGISLTALSVASMEALTPNVIMRRKASAEFQMPFGKPCSWGETISQS
jgi:hypothetical protein